MQITRRFSSKKTLTAGILLTLLLALTVGVASANGFERWPVITVDGEGYYMAGPDTGPNGEPNVPGHYWVQAGPNKVVAKHYNTGPGGSSKFWSSDAPDGALLYIAQIIIDEWTEEKAEMYAARGYVHYHELLSADNGEPHPTKVGWFKHIARTSFTLDGGPGPAFYHSVTPGVDFEFIPNWATPYNP
jgi:selenium-binding protein 1